MNQHKYENIEDEGAEIECGLVDSDDDNTDDDDDDDNYNADAESTASFTDSDDTDNPTRSTAEHVAEEQVACLYMKSFADYANGEGDNIIPESSEAIGVDDGNNLKKAGVCQVCGDDKAYRRHYKVFCCEGCKKFFYNVLNDTSISFECVANNFKCVITPQTRTACKACRFAKCVDVGMKLEYRPLNSKCGVCGDDAPNKFYGAFVCRPCKTFFQKNAAYKRPTTCTKGCELSHVDRRKKCRECRLAKCFAIGMRKNTDD